MEWVREAREKFDGSSKTEIHDLVDCFGGKMQVSIAILKDPDPVVTLKAEKDAMIARAQDYANRLCGRGIDPMQFVVAGWDGGEIDITDCPNCGK